MNQTAMAFQEDELMGELELRILDELKEMPVTILDYPKNKASRQHLWLYISAFQKACRRGHTEVAWEAADKLWQLGRSNHLMKRLATVAGEDIGLGDPKTAIKILVGWKNRAEVTAYRSGDESWIFQLMKDACEAKKNRLGDHFNLLRHIDPDYLKWNHVLSKVRNPTDWVEAEHKDLEPIRRAIKVSMGFRKWAGQLEVPDVKKKTHGGQPKQLLMWLDRYKPISNWLKLACKIQVAKNLSPHWTNILAAKMAGINLCGLEDTELDIPEPTMLAPGVPDYAVDKHSGEGKRTMGYLGAKYGKLDLGNLIFIMEGVQVRVERTNEEMRMIEKAMLADYITNGILAGTFKQDWEGGIEADLLKARKKILNVE